MESIMPCLTFLVYMSYKIDAFAGTMSQMLAPVVPPLCKPCWLQHKPPTWRSAEPTTASSGEQHRLRLVPAECGMFLDFGEVVTYTRRKTWRSAGPNTAAQVSDNKRLFLAYMNINE
eukprot:1157847-Pelagomonas_calceolata.AAC.6